MTEEASYRFGPLERRGLIAGWRGGQIASVAGGLLFAVLVLHARPDMAGAAMAVIAVAAGVALACWPVAGRTGEEWLPTVVRWTTGSVGGRRALSPLPRAGFRRAAADGAESAGDGVDAGGSAGAGHRGAPGRAGAGGGIFAGLSLLGVWPGMVPGEGTDGAGPVGVFFDARARTYTAALVVRGHSFALLGPSDKERRIGGWSAVLASLARERAVVHRLQWIATTIPDDGRGVRGHLAERAALGPGDRAYRSYTDLLDAAGSSASRHEVLVAVQIRVGRTTQRAVRAAGGGGTGAAAVLLREIDSLRSQLADADMVVEGLLGPDELATVVRRTAEAAPVDRAPSNGTRPPPTSWPWPMAVEVGWSSLRTDETWQATYWIAEWPRVDVGSDFLSPMLLGPVRRSVAVVMEPLSPGRATRQVEQARTADVADSELRRRSGFLPTARRAREQELVTRREAELADGHASFRFSGYVTVTAPSPDALEDACEATEQAAGQARLELRRLFGDQGRAFTCSLPLCRGLS